MPDKSLLIEDIHQRNSSSGIITADRYFMEVEGCFNGGFCPTDTVGKSEDEWRKAIKDAESKLTYTNKDMKIDRRTIKQAGDDFMFDAIVTTPLRDSDKDILLTEGATLDKDAPLLWQHMTMNPIGATVETLEHTNEKLRCRFVIADTELGRDAIKLVKIGALRISQGFEPEVWEPMKDGEGYLFKKFRIYEVSLVTIPANSQAVITAMSEKSFDSDLVNKWKSHVVPIQIEPEEESCKCKKELKKPDKYDHIDMKPNDGMKKAAKRGLEWRDEFNRGGTEVGIARGRDISNGKELSPDTWKRMKSFFARHEVDKEAEGFNSGEDGFPSNGRIAWDLWGGDPGKAKAEKVVDQMNSADKKEASEIIAKAGSRISSATRTQLHEAMADLDEICEMENLPRSVSVLAQHARSCIDGVMPSDEDKSFEDVKKKFFAMVAISEKSVLRDLKDQLNVLIQASEKCEDAKAWEDFFSRL
jgi:HK97 family phage prohead protease